MKKVIHKAKRWLSNSTTAFVYAYVEIEDGYKWGQFKLGDCSRIVSFGIDLGSPKERRATVKKLRVIAKEADNMAEAIEGLDE